MHAEREKRIEALRRIQMNVEPQIIIQKLEKLITKLTLKGWPLNEVKGLENFIDVIEKHTFLRLKWERSVNLKNLIQDYIIRKKSYLKFLWKSFILFTRQWRLKS